MKKIFLFIPIIGMLFGSCISDITEGDPYFTTEYKPILMDRADLATSIKWVEPKIIETPGKIYIKDDLLFINERFEGVHVYNNADPSNPIALGFITIPGNLDISIREDIIYADNAKDLATFRVVNESIVMLDRDTDVFPDLGPPDSRGIPSEYIVGNRPENSVIVKWVLK